MTSSSAAATAAVEAAVTADRAAKLALYSAAAASVRSDAAVATMRQKVRVVARNCMGIASICDSGAATTSPFSMVVFLYDAVTAGIATVTSALTASASFVLTVNAAEEAKRKKKEAVMSEMVARTCFVQAGQAVAVLQD